MNVDFSIEYSCSEDEFIGLKVMEYENMGKYLSVHTYYGQKWLWDNYAIIIPLHNRMYLNNEFIHEIHKKIVKDNYSAMIGGFYWLNKEHTKHI